MIESPISSWSVRNIGLLGALLGVVILAYFYALDRAIFSSRSFSYIFSFLIWTRDTNAAWLGAAIGILATLWRRPQPILRLVDLIGDHPGIVSLIVVALCAVGTNLIYLNHPLCMDEYAPYFQSKVFATGRIAAQMQPELVNWLVVREFGSAFMTFSTESGRVIESYWPGFALLLTPFQLLNIAWLCNPLLAGLAIVLIFQITMEITQSRRAGGWAVLFAIGSGAFVVNAISFYSMSAHLTANLLFAWLLMAPNTRRAMAAGLVGSVALVLHNPMPHTLFAAPWIIWLISDQQRRRYLPALIAGYLPVSLCVGLGWLALKSSYFPSATSTSAIASGIFSLPGASVLNMRVAALAKMWVWATPCLILFSIIGASQWWSNRHVRILTISSLLTFAGYLFVNVDQGHGWGYRYFHSSWGALPILAACMLANQPEKPPNLISFAGATATLSLMLLVPFQLYQVNTFVTGYLDQVPSPVRPGNNVYFIDALDGFYLSDLIQFDPLLRNEDLVLAKQPRGLDEALIKTNWPDARRVARGSWGEQWHLGSEDQRVRGNGIAAAHFAIKVPPAIPQH